MTSTGGDGFRKDSGCVKYKRNGPSGVGRMKVGTSLNFSDLYEVIHETRRFLVHTCSCKLTITPRLLYLVSVNGTIKVNFNHFWTLTENFQNVLHGFLSGWYQVCT